MRNMGTFLFVGYLNFYLFATFCFILFYFVCLISSVCCFSAAQTVLIVYAHQSEGSFNAAVKDAAVDALKKQGCNVLVSDLYEMKFKATATKEDITGVCEAVFCLFRK